jgi:hypothetical protein
MRSGSKGVGSVLPWVLGHPSAQIGRLAVPPGVATKMKQRLNSRNNLKKKIHLKKIKNYFKILKLMLGSNDTK